MNVLDRLIEKLDAAQIPYDVSHHEPVFTSEEAARIRGTTLASGAKALICKADKRFVLVVLPADKRLASKRIRKSESIRSLRFAKKIKLGRCEASQITLTNVNQVAGMGGDFRKLFLQGSWILFLAFSCYTKFCLLKVFVPFKFNFF